MDSEEMLCIDDTPFVYNRAYPPLFFATPTPEEQVQWQQSMQKCTNEYNKLVCTYPDRVLDHNIVLSNGITLGEYAMYTLWLRNEKRSKPKKT